MGGAQRRAARLSGVLAQRARSDREALEERLADALARVAELSAVCEGLEDNGREVALLMRGQAEAWAGEEKRLRCLGPPRRLHLDCTP